MKKLLFSLLLVAVSVTTFSQSKSYQTLRDHFAGKEDVHSFALNGFLCRTVLRFAGTDGRTLHTMMKDIHQIRFIVIPIKEFSKQELSVNGFKEYLKKDSFESLATIRDKADHISVFHRMDGNKRDRYFVLVEEPNEVVAIEMKGYIDPALFKNENNRITINQR